MRVRPLLLALAGLALAPLAWAQYGDISDLKLLKPEDREDVKRTPPPKGAVVLFDGKSLDGWVQRGNPKEPAKWKLVDGGAIKVEIEGLTLEDRVTNVITTRLAEAPLVTAAEPFRMEGPGLRGEAPRGRLEPMAGGCRIRLQGKG
jgi:hypothetical protein